MHRSYHLPHDLARDEVRITEVRAPMPGASDPIEDEDAFLYGTSNANSSSANETARSADPPPEPLASSAQEGLPSEPPVANTVESSAPTASALDADVESDYEESDESDIEFIIDPNVPLIPPPRPVPLAPAAPAPKQDAEARIVKEAPAAPAVEAPKTSEPRIEPSTALERPGPPRAAQPSVSEEELGPEGPPPSAPSTGPVLNLDPSGEDLQYPPTDSLYEARTKEEQAQEPPPMTIYQVDIDSLPEKPWRRPGANLSDWFNYGFDEHTWALWCAKKNMMSEARSQLVTENETQTPAVPAMPFMPPMDGAQDAFAAMFGPGVMMNMPTMPGWSQEGPATGLAMPPAMTAMPGAPPWGEAPPVSEPEACSPQDGQHDKRSSKEESRHERRGRRGGRSRHGRSHGGAGRRAEDEDDHNPASHASYADRDTSHGPGDPLDYGARPDEGGWHRGSPRHADYGPGHDEDTYDPEHFGRPPAPQRDRPSRRERERARHDRRLGRGGQKRGPPEGMEDGEYASKRFHGGRGP